MLDQEMGKTSSVRIVLGIAAPRLSGTRWHQVPSLWWQGISGTLSPVARALCWAAGWAPKQGLILLVSVWGRAGGAGWLEALEFCCITVLEKLLLVGKFSEPINWYLSVSHVCGGVNESQQSSFVVAPSAISPQIIQENLQNDGEDVKKVMLPFRK